MVSRAERLGPVRLGLALAGVGRWGRCWLSALQQHPAVDVRWVCDPAPPTDVRESGEARWASELGPALEDPLVSAVVVATPIETHGTLALAALEAGRHLLVEKPLVTETEDLDRLVSAARLRGSLVMVNHLLLYHPAFQMLERYVASGRIGRLRACYAVRVSAGRARTDCPWWTLAPHDLAMVDALAPRLLRKPPTLHFERGVARASLQDGDQSATLIASTNGERKARLFVAAGSEGSLVFDDAERQKLWFHGRPPDLAALAECTDERTLRSRLGFGKSVPCAEESPLDRALDHFVDCVANGRDSRSGVEHARRVLLALVGGKPYAADRLGSGRLEVIA